MQARGFEGFDRIAINGIRGTGYHGVLAAERESGQEFSVDVVLHVDVGQAGRSDSLTDTVDYSEVANSVHAEIVGEPCQLIETLAQRIADAILAIGEAGTIPISIVEVTVHKPSAPIAVPFDDVSVSIVRLR